MKIIPLTRGVVAWVDDEDAAEVLRHRWHACLATNGRWYARTRVERVEVMMHNMLLRTPAGLQGDHIKHCPAVEKVVDNRRSNLRIVTATQNRQNRPRRVDTGSKFKGVRPFSGGRVGAAVYAVGKSHFLGIYPSEVECAYAYDCAALYFFGEHGCTNFPLEGSRHSLRDAHELTPGEIAAIAWRVMGRLAVTDAVRLQAAA